jgi:hypothetical protein
MIGSNGGRGFFEHGNEQSGCLKAGKFLINFLGKILTNQLAPCSRVLLEKLTVIHLVKKFPSFIKLEGSLQCSQIPTTGPYPELDASITPPPNLFF